MSAKHQYFYPCKDLTSPEEKRILQVMADKCMEMSSADAADALHEDYQKFIEEYPQDLDELQTEYFSAWLKQAQKGIKSDSWQNWSAIHSMTITQVASESLLSTIQEIVDRYGGDSFRILLSLDDKDALPLHTDPKIGATTNVNIPLYPDYAFYRPTKFYNSYDENDVLFTVDYKKLRCPSLLNMSKIHNAGHFDEPTHEHYNGKSVALQIMFMDKFETVKKKFQSNGWLSTTPF